MGSATSPIVYGGLVPDIWNTGTAVFLTAPLVMLPDYF